MMVKLNITKTSRVGRFFGSALSAFQGLKICSEPPGLAGDDRQSVAMKDLLDAIYPRSDRSDYVVRLEPIQTTNKAVFQYVATEEELARYPSHTTRCAQTIPPPLFFFLFH